MSNTINSYGKTNYEIRQEQKQAAEKASQERQRIEKETVTPTYKSSYDYSGKSGSKYDFSVGDQGVQNNKK